MIKFYDLKSQANGWPLNLIKLMKITANYMFVCDIQLVPDKMKEYHYLLILLILTIRRKCVRKMGNCIKCGHSIRTLQLTR